MNVRFSKVLKFKKRFPIMLIAFLITNYFFSFSGAMKYAFLLLCSMALAFLTIVNHRELHAKYLILGLPSIIYVIIGLLTAIVRREFHSETIKMTLFIIVPFMAALCIRGVVNNDTFQRVIDICFISTVLFYTVFQRLEDESQYGFILGAYAIYYLNRKRWGLVIIACVLEIFTGKRLAQISLIICILMVFVLDKVTERKKQALSVIFLTIFICATYLYLNLCQNGLANSLMNRYGIIVSGRETAWGVFFNDYRISPLYMGKGIGWVRNKMEGLNNPFFLNLHNDLMQAYIELGFWGYTIWLFAHVAVCISKVSGYKENKLTASVLLLYTLINYATDNIMIYVSYWFPLYLLLIQLMDGTESEASE